MVFSFNITILVNYKDVKVNGKCRIEMKAIISISDACWLHRRVEFSLSCCHPLHVQSPPQLSPAHGQWKLHLSTFRLTKSETFLLFIFTFSKSWNQIVLSLCIQGCPLFCHNFSPAVVLDYRYRIAAKFWKPLSAIQWADLWNNFKREMGIKLLFVSDDQGQS